MILNILEHKDFLRIYSNCGNALYFWQVIDDFYVYAHPFNWSVLIHWSFFFSNSCSDWMTMLVHAIIDWWFSCLLLLLSPTASASLKGHTGFQKKFSIKSVNFTKIDSYLKIFNKSIRNWFLWLLLTIPLDVIVFLQCFLYRP